MTKKRTAKKKRKIGGAKPGVRPIYSDLTGPGAMLARALGDESQTAAARRLGITPGYFNHVIRGRKLPSRQLAVKIRNIYGIPVDAW